MSLAIEKPGMLSLLQDSGRYGYHHLGLTTGGPLDSYSFCWANALCENNLGSTAIELTIGGFTAVFTETTRFAIAGADAPTTLNDQPLSLWRSHLAQPGDRLHIGYARRGTRLYLAVSGGFCVSPWLGSSATVIREGVGGLSGRALASGDTVPYEPDQADRLWQAPAPAKPKYANQATLRVVPGYQNSWFQAADQRQFFSSPYQLSELCDRMGYRLQGAAIVPSQVSMLSEGICLGAVQLPPDGQPIVMLNDRQTIGGYPKIGSVVPTDLGILAQLRGGDSVYFAAVTQATAVHIMTMMRDYLCDLPLEVAERER